MGEQTPSVGRIVHYVNGVMAPVVRSIQRWWIGPPREAYLVAKVRAKGINGVVVALPVLAMQRRRIGPLRWCYGTRSVERRLSSWCGIGPVGELEHALTDPSRRVQGFAVHAGRHLLVIFWK